VTSHDWSMTENGRRAERTHRLLSKTDPFPCDLPMGSQGLSLLGHINLRVLGITRGADKKTVI